MNVIKEAEKIFSELEGTLIADLEGAIFHAENYKELKERYPNKVGGAFNYLLLVISAIACDTLGLYITGDKFHCKRSRSYIMEFIQTRFPKRSDFKRIPKVLEDYLRNVLIHSYGSISSKIEEEHEISLFIGSNDPEILIDPSTKKIKINTLSFARLVKKLFDKIKSEISQDRKLAENIIFASEVLRRDPTKYSDATKAQLNEFYKWKERHME